VPPRSSPRLAPFASFALLAALAGCGRDDGGAVPTARAERGRIERIVVATGTIEPEREVEVRPRIPGIVEAIHVKAGDRVAPGQPLVEIERALLASQADEARATLRSARTAARYAQIELERVAELSRGGASSERAHDDALSRAEQAQAEVARAEAALSTLETQLSYATVTSPLAGRVLDVPVEVGSAVSPVTAVTGGTLLLSLAGTDRLFLEGLVDENEVARVALGQPARLRTEAFAGRTFDGRVAEIAPLGERVQNVTYFEVKVEIVDPDAQRLRPRMSGDADIVTEVVDDALLVPETALRHAGERVYVEVATDEAPGFAERDVEVGIVDGDRVQLLSGVAEGEPVRVR
jgi:HlyD family secretion protein